MRGVQVGQDATGREVWLDDDLRATHLQVVGASGTGKTRFLQHLIRQDIRNGEGLCLLDPTGNLYRRLLRWCETNHYLSRRNILLFEPANPTVSFGFNPLAFEHPPDAREINFAVGSLVATFAQVWGGEDPQKTPLLQRLLKGVFHTLLEHGLTLVEADRLASTLDEDGVRRYLTGTLADPVYRRQWANLNAKRSREFDEEFMSVQNRLHAFLGSPAVRAVVGRTERVLDTRALMDQGGVLLCDLSPGDRRLPPDNARLLGMLLVNDLVQKARGRPEGSRPFSLYIDECYHYLNDDIATILDQMRQFGLRLILAHQHLGQLDEAGSLIKGAILTDAQTKVVFGGLAMESATRLADDLFAGELDLEEPKHVLDKPVVVGYERRWLHSESETETEGESESVSRGSSWGESASGGSVRQWSDANGFATSETTTFTPDGSLFPGGTLTHAAQRGHHQSRTRGGSETRAFSRSTSGSESVSHGTSRSVGTTTGRSETLAPLLKTLPSAVFSLEEQRYRKAAFLRNLPRQMAVVKAPYRRSVVITVPPVEDGYARPERVERFRERAFVKSGVVVPVAEAEAEIKRRGQSLERAACGKDAPGGPDDFLE